MKTITLTESAYKRLKDWKDSDKESFSAVVMKIVPQKGTLGQMLDDVADLRPLSHSEAKVMEDTIKWGRDPGKNRDPWNS